MTEFKLPKKTLTLWKIRLTLISLLFFCLFSYFFHGFKWYLISSVIMLCVFEALLLWYIPTLFKNYKIQYLNGAVMVTVGVIVSVTHIMPFSKLIYTQTVTTPLAKLMGLKAITLKAARSRLLIPELQADEVEKFAAALAEGEL